jgi:HK97 family phage major capsid protein
MNKYFKLAAAEKARAQAIVDLARAENRDLTETEEQDMKAAVTAFESYNSKATDLQKTLDGMSAPLPKPATVGASEPVDAPRMDADIPNILKDPKLGMADANEYFKYVVDAGSAAKQGRPFRNEKFSRISEAFTAIRGAAGASTLVGEDGGFLVPPEFSNDIFKRISGEQLPILGQCQRHSVRGNSLTLNALNDYDRSSTSYRNGGVIVYWPGEGGEITASTLKFRQVNFLLHKLAILSYATSEQLEDSTNFGGNLMASISEAIADELVEKVMFGTGAGQPIGAFSASNPSCVDVSGETSQTTDTIEKANIDKMWARLWSQVKPGSCWYYNTEDLGQLENMVVAGSSSTAAVYMPPGGMADAPYSRLKGRPAYETEHALALGDRGTVCLGNFNQYALVTKGSDIVKTDMSIHVRFIYDETAFRATYRVDGKPLWDRPIVPRKGAAANTLSPFVVLAAI